jgi:predicted phosphoribosyltransferase
MTNPATGVFYYDFRDVPDEDVMLMLKEHQGKMFFGETA